MELVVGPIVIDSEKAMSALEIFIAPLTVISFDRDAAVKAARVKADLRGRGMLIGPYDTLLAGHGLSTGMTVITSNLREFSRVPDLKCVSWR